MVDEHTVVLKVLVIIFMCMSFMLSLVTFYFQRKYEKTAVSLPDGTYKYRNQDWLNYTSAIKIMWIVLLFAVVLMELLFARVDFAGASQLWRTIHYGSVFCFSGVVLASFNERAFHYLMEIAENKAVFFVFNIILFLVVWTSLPILVDIF